MLGARYSQVSPGNGPRWVLAWEVRNQAGYGGYGGDPPLRAADLIAVDTWQSGPVRLVGHEIKTSRTDWLRELADPEKATAFEPYVAEWWLVAADRSIIREGELPLWWGLLAPAGRGLRAIVRAHRREQAPLSLSFTAALLRAVVRGRTAMPGPS